MHRSRGRVALTVIFTLLALNAWAQVALPLVGLSDDPPMLSFLQLLVGAAAALAATGSWLGRHWASGAAVLYGLVTAGMIVSLERLLDLGPESRGGLWTGAAVILLFGVVAAWYLGPGSRQRRQRAP